MLVFTTAIAPWQRSDGELSRFSCEACHLEGGTDGRVHATGRGEVRANTKPLFGIANNAPHFTRALDRDTTAMVFAEFRVASARSGASEWFDLDDAPDDYLAGLPWAADVATSAWGLRRAMLDFFFDFAHPPSEAAGGRLAFRSRSSVAAPSSSPSAASAVTRRARSPTILAPRSIHPPGSSTCSLARDPSSGLARATSAPRSCRTCMPRARARPRSAVSRADRRSSATARRRASRSCSSGSGYTDDAFFHDGAPEGATALDDEQIDALHRFPGVAVIVLRRIELPRPSVAATSRAKLRLERMLGRVEGRHGSGRARRLCRRRVRQRSDLARSRGARVLGRRRRGRHACRRRRRDPRDAARWRLRQIRRLHPRRRRDRIGDRGAVVDPRDRSRRAHRRRRARGRDRRAARRRRSRGALLRARPELAHLVSARRHHRRERRRSTCARLRRDAGLGARTRDRARRRRAQLRGKAHEERA
jgi:hypothetical protein